MTPTPCWMVRVVLHDLLGTRGTREDGRAGRPPSSSERTLADPTANRSNDPTINRRACRW